MEQYPFITPEDDSGFAPVDTNPVTVKDAGMAQVDAEEKALKAHVALGSDSPGIETLTNAYLQGTEKQYAISLATKQSLEDENLKMRLMEEVAKKRGVDGTLSKSDLDLVNTIVSHKSEVNPEIAIEREFAKKYSDATYAAASDGPVSGVSAETLAAAQDIHRDLVAKNEILKSVEAKLNSAYEKESFDYKVYDFSKFFVPFGEQASNAAAQEKNFSALFGSNTQEFISRLWLLPSDQFEKKLTETVDTLNNISPSFAREFVRRVSNFDNFEKVLLNLTTALDVFPFAGKAVSKLAAKVGTKAAGAPLRSSRVIEESVAKLFPEKEKDLVKHLTDTVSAAAITRQTPDELIARTGDVASAALLRAQSKLDGLEAVHLQRLGRTPVDEVRLSFMNPFKYLKNLENIHLDRLARIVPELQKSDSLLKKALTEVSKVQRVTEPEVLKAMVEEATSKLQNIYSVPSKGIIDVAVQAEDGGLTNAYKAEFVLGDPAEGTLFSSRKRAQQFANIRYRLPKGSYTIEQKGSGYYLKVEKPLDETSPTVRDVVFKTDSSERVTPINALLGRIRNADNVLRKGNVRARKTAVYGQQALFDFVKQAAEPLATLPKKEKGPLLRYMKANQRVANMATQSAGIQMETVGEFVENYTRVMGVAPTEKQAAAYFNYYQLLDFDYAVRNLSIKRDLTRQGVETIFIPKVKDSEFLGKVVDDVPWTFSADANIAVVSDDASSVRVFSKNNPGGEDVESLRDQIKEGTLKVVQVADSGSQPLGRSFGVKQPVNFVLLKKVGTKPLPDKLINYNPGAGHIIYKDNYFVKMPRVVGSGSFKKYIGDIAIASTVSKKEAQEVQKLLDKAFEMVRNEDPGAEQFIKENLPWSPKRILSALNQEGALGKTFVTQNGRRTIDDNKIIEGTVVDADKSPFDLISESKVGFMSERDFLLPRASVEGTEGNPIVRLSNDNILDPIDSLAQAVHDDGSLMFIKDYKAKAVEDFFREFGDTVKNYKKGSLTNIQEAFNRPAWDERYPDPVKLRNAKNTWKTMFELWKAPDAQEGFRRWAKGAVIDLAYNIGGTKTAEVVSDYALPLIKNPFTYLRSFAFHSSIGLFNINQIIQQSLGAVNAVAFSNSVKDASKAFVDSWHILPAIYSPKHVKEIAKTRAKVGSRLHFKGDLSEKQFLEMIETAIDSGFMIAGNEFAYLSDVVSPELFKGTVGKFLEKGTAPFKLGERSSRAVAWSIAYRELRKEKPFGKLTDADKAKILDRADSLVGSMSVASSTGLQKGLASIPTQFWTYTMHIAEQFIGTARSDPLKFLKALGIYSVAFGGAGALGAATTLPVNESLRKFLLEWDRDHGTDYANYLSHPAIQTAIEGPVAAAITSSAGKDYDVVQPYGPMGLKVWSLMGDLLTNGVDSDTSDAFVKVLIGASGTKLKSILESLPSAIGYVSSVFVDKNDPAFVPTASDFLDVLSNVTSVKGLANAYKLANYQRFITKGGFVSSEDPIKDSVFAFLGANPRELSDAYIKFRSAKSDKKLLQKVQKDVGKEVLYMLSASSEREARAHARRIRAILIMSGINELEQGKILSGALSSNRDLIRNSEEKFRRFLNLKNKGNN